MRAKRQCAGACQRAQRHFVKGMFPILCSDGAGGANSAGDAAHTEAAEMGPDTFITVPHRTYTRCGRLREKNLLNYRVKMAGDKQACEDWEHFGWNNAGTVWRT